MGNKKKLTQWQDKFWTHMVEKYPELERGESASETGRDHIPPRLFKEVTHLTKQKEKLDKLLTEVKRTNAAEKVKEISALLDKYIPGLERMSTEMKKYRQAFSEATAEKDALIAENENLKNALEAKKQKKTLEMLADFQLRRDYEDALKVLERIPPEVLREYTSKPSAKQRERGECR